MNEKTAIVETIQQVLYGKSSNPFAEENIGDDDFQDGYRIGEKDLQDSFISKAWSFAWFEIYKEQDNPQWKNWKRGYHAGKMSASILK